jgi:hypothetical protein
LPRLVSFLLNAPRAGLQVELNAFLDYALPQEEGRSITKSAFCQARRDLNPESLRALLAQSSRLITDHHPEPCWAMRRVVAIDATTLRVPRTPECAEYFGGMTTSCGKFRPLARASALYDVARGCFVDAVIGGLATDERKLAAHHLDALGPNDLLLMDRGYPSRSWFGALNARGVGFCARISSVRWGSVVRFERSDSSDEFVDLGTPDSPLPLRLLRHVLPNGSTLILATNILDSQITPAAFADLYHSRWRIEEGFKLLKARLQVENWSGVLPHTVLQDFFAALVRINCAAVLALEIKTSSSTGKPEGEESPSSLGWRSALNATLVIKALRHYLPRLLLERDNAGVLTKLLVRLRSPGASEKTRANRKEDRPKGVRLAGFHPAYKAA